MKKLPTIIIAIIIAMPPNAEASGRSSSGHTLAEALALRPALLVCLAKPHFAKRAGLRPMAAGNIAKTADKSSNLDRSRKKFCSATELVELLFNTQMYRINEKRIRYKVIENYEDKDIEIICVKFRFWYEKSEPCNFEVNFYSFDYFAIVQAFSYFEEFALQTSPGGKEFLILAAPYHEGLVEMLVCRSISSQAREHFYKLLKTALFRMPILGSLARKLISPSEKEILANNQPVNLPVVARKTMLLPTQLTGSSQIQTTGEISDDFWKILIDPGMLLDPDSLALFLKMRRLGVLMFHTHSSFKRESRCPLDNRQSIIAVRSAGEMNKLLHIASAILEIFKMVNYQPKGTEKEIYIEPWQTTPEKGNVSIFFRRYGKNYNGGRIEIFNLPNGRIKIVVDLAEYKGVFEFDSQDYLGFQQNFYFNYTRAVALLPEKAGNIKFDEFIAAIAQARLQESVGQARLNDTVGQARLNDTVGQARLTESVGQAA